MDPMTLEVTDLRQWRMCPRVVWYRHCLPAVRPITDLMRHGKEHHRQEEGREERRSLRTYGLSVGEWHFDLTFFSERLGLRGRVDLAIAVPDRTSPGAEAVIVEFKDTEQSIGPHMKLQVAAYALLLEETWGLPVHVGWIYKIPLRRAERIAITSALRRQVINTVTTIQTAIHSETMPSPPTGRALCVNCEFRRFCNDVV